MKTALAILAALALLVLGFGYVFLASPVTGANRVQMASPVPQMEIPAPLPDDDPPDDVEGEGMMDTPDTLHEDAQAPVKDLKVFSLKPDARVPTKIKKIPLPVAPPAPPAPPAPKMVQVKVKQVKRMSTDLQKIRAVIKYRKNQRILDYGQKKGWSKGRKPKLRRPSRPRPTDLEQYKKDMELYPQWQKAKKVKMPMAEPKL